MVSQAEKHCSRRHGKPQSRDIRLHISISRPISSVVWTRITLIKLFRIFLRSFASWTFIARIYVVFSIEIENIFKRKLNIHKTVRAAWEFKHSSETRYHVGLKSKILSVGLYWRLFHLQCWMTLMWVKKYRPTFIRPKPF